MHGLLASLALSALLFAVKVFARHGGAISALNSASADTRKARRRGRKDARSRRSHTAAAGARRRRMVRR